MARDLLWVGKQILSVSKAGGKNQNKVAYRKWASYVVCKCHKSFSGMGWVVQLLTVSTLTTVDLNKVNVVVRL